MGSSLAGSGSCTQQPGEGSEWTLEASELVEVAAGFEIRWESCLRGEGVSELLIDTVLSPPSGKQEGLRDHARLVWLLCLGLLYRDALTWPGDVSFGFTRRVGRDRCQSQSQLRTCPKNSPVSATSTPGATGLGSAGVGEGGERAP